MKLFQLRKVNQYFFGAVYEIEVSMAFSEGPSRWYMTEVSVSKALFSFNFPKNFIKSIIRDEIT